MNRLVLAMFFAVSLTLSTGCNQNRISELESEVSELQGQAEEYESRIADLESSLDEGVSSLNSSVASFQGVAADIALAQAMMYSDHSSGVYSTQTAADNLDAAISDLESSIDELSGSL